MSEITGEIAFRGYEQSDTLNEFAAALAKAQGAMGHARKDSENPHFRSKYADLASVWDACRAALSSNCLAVVQMPALTSSGDLELTTQLIHSSGQWIRSTVAAKPAKCDPQGIGSAVTYLRRYGLSAMVGVAPEEDDGEGAAGRGQPANNGNGGIQAPPSSKPATRTAAPRIDNKDADFRALAEELRTAIDACQSDPDLDGLEDSRSADFENLRKHSASAHSFLKERIKFQRSKFSHPTAGKAA